jgi:PHP family Zn ribbon phosphoesterase
MLVTKQARQFRLRACTRCRGDAYVDFSDYEQEWRCLQCGRTVQPEAAARLLNEGEDRLAA